MNRAAILAIVVFAAGPAVARTNTLTCTQFASYFGESFAAGDFDGDGFGDLLVGSYLYDAPEFGEGVAFAFPGRPGGIPDGDENDAVSRLQSNILHAHHGFAMDGAGDVDGDGYDDVILAVGLRVVPQVEPGYVLIYRGGPDGIGDGTVASADTRLWNDLSGWIGDRVFGVGDVNGDGYDDVASSGRHGVFIWHGSADGIPDGGAETAAAAVLVNQGGNFTFHVAGGDVNGDGYDDVAIGIPDYDAGEGYGEGAIFLFLGGPSGIGGGSVSLADTMLQADIPHGRFGGFFAIGDLDGDSFADLITAGVSVFRGSAAGIPSGSIASADSRVDVIGGLVDVLDFDGDGTDDLVVAEYPGWFYLVRGVPGGPLPDGPLAVVGTPIDEFVAGRGFAAGDLDGDGAEDLVRAPLNNQSLDVRIVYGPEAPGGAIAAIASACLVAAQRRRAARSSG